MRKSIFAMLLVLMLILSGCSDVSTAPTKNDDNELVMETEVTAETESTESIYSSESKESEAPETEAELETEAEITECEPVQSENAKQTEPTKQAEAQTPAEIKPQETVTPEAPPETTTQTTTEQPKVEETAPIEPTVTETPNATADDCKAIADKILEYINSYRSTPAVKLTGLTEYTEYRSRQLVSNFAHSTADERAAATALQYGEYVDPALYGMTGDPYYTACARDAIAKAGYVGTVDEVAEKFAQLIKNSQSHWAYVGSSEYGYIAVGVTYKSGMWYVDVAMAIENTDNK